MIVGMLAATAICRPATAREDSPMTRLFPTILTIFVLACHDSKPPPGFSPEPAREYVAGWAMVPPSENLRVVSTSLGDEEMYFPSDIDTLPDGRSLCTVLTSGRNEYEGALLGILFTRIESAPSIEGIGLKRISDVGDSIVSAIEGTVESDWNASTKELFVHATLQGFDGSGGMVRVKKAFKLGPFE